MRKILLIFILLSSLTIAAQEIRKGDANDDNMVNVADIVAVINHIMDSSSDIFSETRADANGDGVVNADDIVTIINVIIGKGSTQTRHPFETNQLIGHRGDCSNAPENTMPSFEYAVNVLGLQWIECDPCVTKDGVIVLNHGKTINDHSDGEGYIDQMTYEELCKINFGHPQKFGEMYKDTKICTAQEVLTFAKKNNVIVEFDFSHFYATPEKVKKLYKIVQDNDYLNSSFAC